MLSSVILGGTFCAAAEEAKAPDSGASSEKLSKLFGEVTFVRHEVTDLAARGRQAETVLAFKDIGKFTLPAMPHRGANWTGQKMTFRLGEPVVVHERWRNAYYTRRPLTISFTPKTKATPPAGRKVPPAEKEKLQVLLPVIRAMLEGFRMTIRLEAFGPVEGKSKTHVIFDLNGGTASGSFSAIVHNVPACTPEVSIAGGDVVLTLPPPRGTVVMVR